MAAEKFVLFPLDLDARNFNLKLKVSFLAFYFHNPVQKKIRVLHLSSS